jgi:hypothetical protein
MTQYYPAYQLTYADIDRLKVVAARIFDRKVSPQSRLEIISRSSGFNSFAALKTALKEGPIWLIGDQSREEEHINQAGIDLNSVPFVSGISLNEIIAAGLAWSERTDPEWAATKAPRQRLKTLKRDGGTLRQYLEFIYGEIRSRSSDLHVYRSSLTWTDLRNLEEKVRSRNRMKDTAVIMTSPRNACDVSFDPSTEEPRSMRPGAWRCARVSLGDDARYFDTPAAEPVPWGDRAALERLILDARIIVFDDDDLADVKAALKSAGVPSLEAFHFVVIKSGALAIEDEREGTFFSVGYYGTARSGCPPPKVCQDTEILSDFAFSWMCEIVNVVHGCNYEMARMSRGDSSYVEDLMNEGQHRLIVPI